MVLQSNFAKRIISNAENTPPVSVLPSKSLAARLRSSLHSAARRRRTNHGSSSSSNAKYTIEQAARRSRTKSPATSLKFKVRAIGGAPLPIPDIEMADASMSTSSPSTTTNSTAPRTVPVMLPKELGRPEYCEVSREALLAADPELTDVEPSYLREGLEAFGPQLLRTLSSVRASAPTSQDALPTELSIVVHDLTTALPSHMLAVYGPASKSTSSSSTPPQKRKVTLYPVHSLYLAAHCARLPPFPSPSSSSSTQTQPQNPPVAPGATSVQYTVPVRPLCLPSPSTYPRLSSFLYTKRADTLLASLLPTPPPPSLLSSLSTPVSSSSSPPPSTSDPTPTQTAPAPAPSTATATRDYATHLAQTYTPQALLQHALLVHGLWQNVCALGIFEDALWEVVDVAWRVLLAGIALGTGGDVDAVLGGREEEERRRSVEH